MAGCTCVSSTSRGGSAFLLTGALVASALLASPADARKARLEDRPLACPSDAPVLVGSPGSVSRFSALAGCAEVAVIPEMDAAMMAEAEPGDYVVQATRRDREGRLADGSFFQVASLTEAGDDANAAPRGDVRVQGGRTTSGIRVTTISPVDEEGEPEPASDVAPAAPVRWTDSAPATAVPAPVLAVDTAERLLALRPVLAPTRFDDVIGEVARRQRVDALLLHAVIKNESAYRPAIRSHAGAVGMMQIMPGTGRMLGVRPAHLTHPPTNIDAGARLLRKLAAKYGNDFRLVLAAYNAGEGAVAKYGNKVPPYRETQGYVKKVLGTYAKLCADNGIPYAYAD